MLDVVRRFWADHPPTTTIVSVVEIAGDRFVLAPDHLRPQVTTADVDDLLHVAGPGARLVGIADLAYTGTCVDVPDDVVVIADDDARLAMLERACPRAAWLEASMDETMTQRFAVATTDGGAILACAGYRDWSDLIGQQCVLTHPGHRRTGHAQRVAAASTTAAIDTGLVAQWRSEISNTASKRLGERLGYVTIGRQTTVRLASTTGR